MKAKIGIFGSAVDENPTRKNERTDKHDHRKAKEPRATFSNDARAHARSIGRNNGSAGWFWHDFFKIGFRLPGRNLTEG